MVTYSHETSTHCRTQGKTQRVPARRASGESFTVLDRNTAIAQIVPLRERPGIRIRKPASGSPTPNKVALPKSPQLKIDVLELLLEERQSHR